MSIALWIGGGIVCLVVLYLAIMVIATMVTGARGRAPEGIELAVEAPSTCSTGEEVTLVIRVVNELDRVRTLKSVDLDRAFGDGFEVVSVHPKPTEVSGEPVLGVYIHSMNAAIPAKGQLEVRFRLRSRSAGQFSGKTNVYVDSGALRWAEAVVTMNVF